MWLLENQMLSVLVWDFDPVLVQWGSLTIRYYGVLFSLTLLVGYFLWRWQVLRGGHGMKIADAFLLWGVVGVVVGARLGHCLFYEPQVYLSHPERMLEVWKGGLSSHGALVGLALVLWGFSRRYKLRVLEVMDRFSFAAAAGAVGIRTANFLNSEIVGRVTDVPWAVLFVRADPPGTNPPILSAAPRHPAQLYEGLLALLVLAALVLIDRKAGKEKRPLGLLTGCFLTLYFGGRLFTEFFKEYQTTWEQHLHVNAGQLLSLPPFFAGLAVLWWTWRKRVPGGGAATPKTEIRNPKQIPKGKNSNSKR